MDTLDAGSDQYWGFTTIEAEAQPRPHWLLTVLALPFVPFVLGRRGIRWLFARAVPAVARATFRALAILLTPVRLLWIWMVMRPARWLGRGLATPLPALGRAVGRGLRQIASSLTGR